MRLIDADALFAEIKERHDMFADCEYIGDKARRDELSAFMADIMNAPTIGGWISVKDRLPEEYERILTYDKYSDVKENRLLRSYPCVSWSYGFHVTHWMPLPEPPKEEAT